MKTLTFLFVVAIAFNLTLSLPKQSAVNEWKKFLVEYKRAYIDDTEKELRMKTFRRNEDFIAKHNADYEKGLVSFKMQINKYADMLPHEIVDMLNGFNRTIPEHTMKGFEEPVGEEFKSVSRADPPETVDWRQKGAVTPVKNQGKCGSCWAFAATGSIEGQNYVKTGKLVSLSEQNLVDCSGKYGNNGCKGGMPSRAFQYVKDNNGIDTENSYPYKGQQGNCKFQSKNIGAKITGFVSIPKGDEETLMNAVATVGPISVAIDASRRSFHLYSKGVYYDPQCSSSHFDHAVLVVGYGTENGNDYWLVKNSWGKDWGDNGYIKMARNKNNHCGIATVATYSRI